MIIHYNCTIGSFLLHSFLLIYHPYPPSFHEMIFILVYDDSQVQVCVWYTNNYMDSHTFGLIYIYILQYEVNLT